MCEFRDPFTTHGDGLFFTRRVKRPCSSLRIQGLTLNLEKILEFLPRAATNVA
jgi:hypothetical protein